MPRLKTLGLLDPNSTEMVNLHQPAKDMFVVDLPLAAVSDSPYLMRLTFDEKFVKGLARSIRAVGLIEPIIVRPLVDRPGYYETIAGHYRRRAVQLLGHSTIRALVRTFSDSEAAVAAVVTNDARIGSN